MRKRRLVLTLAAPAVVVAALGACDRDEPAPPPQPLVPAAPARGVAMRIDDIEIGRTFDGYAISATGTFTGRGWTLPGLRIRDEEGLGPDGYLDLELTAQVPPTVAPAEGETRMTGHALVRNAQVAGAKGVRVGAWSGSEEAAIP
jgi:hypothetical protein